jgi:hypothetical protein
LGRRFRLGKGIIWRRMSPWNFIREKGIVCGYHLQERVGIIWGVRISSGKRLTSVKRITSGGII